MNLWIWTNIDLTSCSGCCSGMPGDPWDTCWQSDPCLQWPTAVGNPSGRNQRGDHGDHTEELSPIPLPPAVGRSWSWMVSYRVGGKADADTIAPFLVVGFIWRSNTMTFPPMRTVEATPLTFCPSNILKSVAVLCVFELTVWDSWGSQMTKSASDPSAIRPKRKMVI